MKKLLHEFTGYTTASGCAFLVDVCCLWVLVHFLLFSFITAATFSFLAGASVAYALSVRLAFKEHRMSNRRIEFLSFIALGTVGLGVNVIVISASIKYLGVHYLAAKCMAAACTFFCNFLLRRQFLFIAPTYLPEKSQSV